MKTCTNCKKRKRITEFYVTSGGKRPGLVAAECKVCKAVYGKRYYEAHKAEKKAWSVQMYGALKDKVFAAYGGFRCACCSETEPLFLTIDHIENNGNEHRRSITANGGDHRYSSGILTYRWLVKNGFPPGFQVLCANCNHGKHRNGGVCPHQRSEGSTTRAKARTAKRPEVRSPRKG